jgi:glycosyltransferase involved in cell wall biosynthesis
VIRGHRVTPTASVIIPNFNHATVIGRAITSVLAQGDAVGELIVIDDGSTDGSVPAIEAALRGHAKARLLRNDKNQGAIAALNRGISEASAEFVLLGAADDYYLPGMIATCLDAARSSPQAGLVCGNTVVVLADGSRLHVALPFGREPHYVAPDEVVEIARRYNFFFYTGSALLRREAVLAAGSLIPELRWHADWFLDFVLALRHGIAFLPEECSVMSTSPGSYSQGRHDWKEQLPILTRIIRTTRRNYSDVMPQFRRTALLPGFNIAFLRPLLADPELRQFATPLLLWRCVAFRPLRGIGRFLPWHVRQRLRAFLRI